MVSRPVGAFAVAHTTVAILLPRVYLGLHRPTDLLGGAAVGLLGLTAVWKWPARDRVVGTLLGWERGRPALFYPLLFLFIFELTELFTSVRYGLAILRRLTFAA
jgi:undecaprenyl-diphosphatase